MPGGPSEPTRCETQGGPKGPGPWTQEGDPTVGDLPASWTFPSVSHGHPINNLWWPCGRKGDMAGRWISSLGSLWVPSSLALRILCPTNESIKSMREESPRGKPKAWDIFPVTRWALSQRRALKATQELPRDGKTQGSMPLTCGISQRNPGFPHGNLHVSGNSRS